MAIVWVQNEETYYATVQQGDQAYHIVVEKIPGRIHWDWTAWRRGEPPQSAKTGVASTAESARVNAETVANNELSSG